MKIDYDNFDTNINKIKNNPWKPVVEYLIFGVIWIVFSDKILEILISDYNLYYDIQTYKGLLYILITAIFLYFWIKRDNKKIYKLNSEIVDNNQKLLAYSEELIAKEEDDLNKINNLKMLTDEINSQKQFVEDIFDNSNTVIMIWELDGTTIEMNKCTTEILGYGHEIIGKKWMDVMTPEYEKKGLESFMSKLKEGFNVTNYENKVITKDGKLLDMKWNDAVIKSPINGELIVVSFGIDITEQKRNERKVLEISFKDRLTGLNNRIVFENELDKMTSEDDLFTVFLIDVDNFKRLNEMYGHNYGDLFLKQYAEMLKQIFKLDKVYRWGGDEFLLIKSGVGKFDCIDTINKLMENSNKKWNLKNIEFNTTVSIGIVKYPQDGKERFELYKNLDLALYNSKGKGKGRYSFYSDSLLKELEMNSFLERELLDAIDNNKFELFFQPIWSIEFSEIVSFELLLRWNENNTKLNIGEIIGFAEKTGIITKIDRWVVKEAFKLISENFGESSKYIFSINLSAQSFNSEDFMEFLKTQLKELRVDNGLIEFEITEHTLVDDIEYSARKMKNLKSLGFKIALDDFGTRFSSLNYLSKLPFDVLKVDKSYIDSICEINNDKIIVSQIIKLAKNLGLETVAEGIETKEQLDMLKELKCDYGQGYYLSKPKSLDSILEEI